MTREEEMAEIRRRRAELDKRYRELKDEGRVEAGKARIARRKTYSANKGEVWTLSYRTPMNTYGRSKAEQYKALMSGTRGECVDAIPEIVKDLQALYDAVKGEVHFV